MFTLSYGLYVLTAGDASDNGCIIDAAAQVASDPDRIAISVRKENYTREIIQKTGHSTTMVPARGMYSGKETNMLICVVNKTQAAAVSRIVRKYPYTFAVMDPVGEVMGNFKKLDEDGKAVVEMLDAGDGKTL